MISVFFCITMIKSHVQNDLPGLSETTVSWITDYFTDCEPSERWCCFLGRNKPDKRQQARDDTSVTEKR